MQVKTYLITPAFADKSGGALGLEFSKLSFLGQRWVGTQSWHPLLLPGKMLSVAWQNTTDTAGTGSWRRQITTDTAVPGKMPSVA